MSKAPGTPEPARKKKVRMNAKAEAEKESVPIYPSTLGSPRKEKGTRSPCEKNSQMRRSSKKLRDRKSVV